MTAVDSELVITEPGVYELTDEQYHADLVPGGSLSSSGARKLLPPSCPALYKYDRDNDEKPRKTFDIGNAAHKFTLGIGPEVVEIKHDSWRTNAAKDAGAEVRYAGGVPLLTADYEVVKAMSAALAKHKAAMALFSHGTPEASLFWRDERMKEVWRRSRLDWLPDANGGRMVVPDLKTAVCAQKDKFAKAAVDLGYHQQAAFYLDAVKALTTDDEPAFVFVVQEKTPPYLVNVIQLDAQAIEIGRKRNRDAIAVYAECAATDTWPGYSDEVELVSLPYYYTRNFEDTL